MREPAYVIDLRHIYSGKVRDIYDAGNGRLLLVTSDRISAFDVVMDQTIAHKGRVLTATSSFWFEHLGDVVSNHLLSTDVADVGAAATVEDLAGRIMLTERAEMVPIECVVRGYLAGSAWKEYSARGTVHEQPLPPGLREGDQLPEPIFTPATKAQDGLHDENITVDQAAAIVGLPLVERLREVSLELYRRGAAVTGECGIILADTKFEFGHIDDRLVLADEVLTPDSSRFWPAEQWSPGGAQPSFDKQPVRDFLETLDWPKTYPPPTLPAEVTQATSERYTEAYERITGRRFAEWPGVIS